MVTDCNRITIIHQNSNDMIVKTNLFVSGTFQPQTFDTRFLDRNYDDEWYAYWIFTDENGNIHEVNIDKNVSDGFFKNSGTDKIWFSYGDFVDGRDPDTVSDLTFMFCDLEKAGGSFSISRLSREDLEQKGFDTSNVDDDTMQRLADKLGEDYCEQLFWESLEILAECMDIPRKEGWNPDDDDDDDE